LHFDIGNTGNLDTIAQAGGTEGAPHIDPANVGQQFVDAMNTIRARARACEYSMPRPSSAMLDLDRVNVRLAGGGPGAVLRKVADAAGCDPMAGGWYYDRPVNPTCIVLCRASCNVTMQGSQSVEIQIGCPTVM
jgi:hypothetical protein